MVTKKRFESLNVWLMINCFKILTQKKTKMHAEFRLITFRSMIDLPASHRKILLTRYEMTETVFFLRTKPLKHLLNDCLHHYFFFFFFHFHLTVLYLNDFTLREHLFYDNFPSFPCPHTWGLQTKIYLDI